ncbi:MAG: PilN domain-containing protein [Deltaproteobacteria bacterium]|jgi:Tfp pilus assembly protein PilN|nr:PilN domain-containing protein [Deltaproteobacteria bacterium]
MIRINLLPLESFRQTASGQLSVTIFAVCLLGSGLLLYLINMSVLTPALEALQAVKTEQSNKLAGLKKDSRVARQQTSDFVNDLVQLASIAEIEERRRDQSRLFMNLAGLMNSQTSWLLSCSHNSGALVVKGLATDPESVASFLSRLEKSHLLRNVFLQRAAGDTTINNIRLVTFEIKADTVFPQPTLMSMGLPNVKFPSQEDVRKVVSEAAPELIEVLDRDKNVAKAL